MASGQRACVGAARSPATGLRAGVPAPARAALVAPRVIAKLRPVTRPTIAGAPCTAQGFYEARPGDIQDRANLLLVDVREEAELLDPLGHVHGARHVPLARLLADGLPDVAPETPVALMCKAGGRSARAAASLVARGFTEVYSVTGGMIRWNAEERPVARTRTRT